MYKKGTSSNTIYLLRCEFGGGVFLFSRNKVIIVFGKVQNNQKIIVVYIDMLDKIM